MFSHTRAMVRVQPGDDMRTLTDLCRIHNAVLGKRIMRRFKPQVAYRRCSIPHSQPLRDTFHNTAAKRGIVEFNHGALGGQRRADEGREKDRVPDAHDACSCANGNCYYLDCWEPGSRRLWLIFESSREPSSYL